MEKETKKLYRSQSDRMLAGVCGGLGAYFGIDSTILRILFVLLTVFVGGGFIVYILLWIFIPQEPSDMETPPEKPADEDSM